MNKKSLISSLLCVLFLFSGGITATVADSSLSGILTSWIDDKTEQSITEIERAIKEEQAVQTDRLKQVLAEQILDVEQEWDEFVEFEKEKQLTILQEHTDAQIAELGKLADIDPKRRVAVEKELDRIFQEAVKEMENIRLENGTEEGE